MKGGAAKSRSQVPTGTKAVDAFAALMDLSATGRRKGVSKRGSTTVRNPASLPLTGSAPELRAGSSSGALRPLTSSYRLQTSASAPLLRPASPSRKSAALGVRPMTPADLQPLNASAPLSRPASPSRRSAAPGDHPVTPAELQQVCGRSRPTSSVIRAPRHHLGPVTPKQAAMPKSSAGFDELFGESQLVCPSSSAQPSRARPVSSSTTRSRRSRGTHRPKKLDPVACMPAALSFDQIFKLSYKRAAKTTACKRQCGKHQSASQASQLKELLASRRALKERSQEPELLELSSRMRRRVYSSATEEKEEETRIDPIAEELRPQSLRLRRGSVMAARRNATGRSSIFTAPVKLQELEKILLTARATQDSDSDDTDESDDEVPDDLADIFRTPDREKVLARMSGNAFTSEEESEIFKAFAAYPYEDSDEIHEDSVGNVLDRLGYLEVSSEDVKKLIRETTQYATLNFQEFLIFMRKAADHERDSIKRHFDNSDRDGSGSIDIDELADVLKSIGIYPFRSTVEGALAVVDEDMSGNIEFAEFVMLLAIYKNTGGFSRDEVKRLYRVFTRFAEQPTRGQPRSMKVSSLALSLLYMFGAQVASLISVIAESAILSVPKSRIHEGEKAKREQAEASMTFREFLRWARRLREAEVEVYRAEFERCDEDGTGALDSEEIRSVLFKLGYTPLRAVIYDLIDTYDTDQGGTLDFDEFVNMMQLFRKTDGFPRADLTEFRALFHKFDKDFGGAGEVDVFQVSGILRSLAYEVDIKSVAAMVRTVDWNNTNMLDFQEFLRLMRVNREAELNKLGRIFLQFAVDESGEPALHLNRDGIVNMQDIHHCSMDKAHVDVCLARMGIPATATKAMLSIYSSLKRGSMIDFDFCVGMLDGCRKIIRKQLVKQAGYNNARFENFCRQFQDLDDNGDGTLEGAELTGLIQRYGFELRTKEDQKEYLRMVSEAWKNAVASGYTKAEVGKEGPTVTLAVFIHLMRLLQNKADQKLVASWDNKTDHGFTRSELQELKSVFDCILKKRSLLDKEHLDQEGLWEMLDKVNVKLTVLQKNNLKVKLFTQTKGADLIGFHDFLKLLNWLIITEIKQDHKMVSTV
eukprot:TRINITY_DN22915_c0_g1_i2.p1 TRINITY_DN22915_c0_g1~~TRINITY_DN22915_c0_g1_i2.p1  ORF type:complete len:1096 (-),score=232.65 TRINITY_DN22915_c0_g1_i2:55-3342(-)